MEKKRLLIESWLPIEAIGAEGKRENSTGQHPAPNRLHVWWARRPLIASRAAVLAGVLPAWSPDWPEQLHSIFPDEQTYHNWFLRVIGIFGDPVAARKLIDWEKRNGVRSIQDKYGYARAFTYNPTREELQTIGELLELTWGNRLPTILDPFAGGGSIPFESLRLGFTTFATDLNPVAAVILKATLEYPARFGVELSESLQKWGKRWSDLARLQLEPYFTAPEGEPKRTIYMWARSVACPSTGKPVPLSPNWWISSSGDLIAARLIAEPGMHMPRFEIVAGAKAHASNPDVGTISKGVARSPWTGETISGEYIKAEAQAGRMGQFLYCVEIETTKGREYISPTDYDLAVFQQAEITLAQKKAGWIAKNIIPTEPFPEGNDNRPIVYGMPYWIDFFSPRQLLTKGVYTETLRELETEIHAAEPAEKATAILTYLAFAIDKCLNYNSRLSSWHSSRGVIRSVFDRHDFAFAWSFVEFNGAGGFLTWGVNQVIDAYREIAKLLSPDHNSLLMLNQPVPMLNLRIQKGSAASISGIEDNSIYNITVDPPYYDNVQYAELSDFFYVWLKRSVGHLFPEFFADELTNKDDEAVANPARFEGMGKNKKELAKQDYERKMAAAFREMYRVLHPDGCLTVMFTHKKVEAWDTLATALINAGFTIQASWPVHTESEHSLHQAKKNAASSTILLACRKRLPSPGGRGAGGEVWWDDLQNLVRQTARQKAEQFAAQGMHGVDLYLSTFGPTLSIISEHWPVLTSEVDPKTGQPKTLRPETALDLAREEVIRLRKQGLLLGHDIQFDPVTDWYLMAWDAFSAEQFPYDEARKLAIALGVDLDHDLMSIERLAVKKGEFVSLQKPAERRKRGMVDEEARSFEHWIDSAHTAMMIYAEDGAGPCEVFLRESGLRRDGTFKALIQALLNAIPHTRIKGKFLRPEAETLENMRLAFFDDILAPVEEEPEMPSDRQMALHEAPGGYEFGENQEEGEVNEEE